MLLNLQISFEDRGCMYYSLMNFNPFLPIGWYISRIFAKLFWKAANKNKMNEKLGNPTINPNPTGGNSQYISTGVEVGSDSHAAPTLPALHPSPHPSPQSSACS